MTKETLAYENIDREFKELYVSDIKKTVVAFANTEGGILYIGINDAGGCRSAKRRRCNAADSQYA